MLNARIPFYACPLCESRKIEENITGDCSKHLRYVDVIPSQMRWMECEQCKHQFIDGYFSEEALKVIFSTVGERQTVGFDFENQRIVPLWYCYEMLARQEYYTQKFSNKIAMHHVALEDLTTKAGAQDFHKALGLYGECELPSPKNENKAKPSEQLVHNVSDIVSKVNCDMPQLVEDLIKGGFNFDVAD